MKSKILSLFLLSVILLSVGMISAYVEFVPESLSLTAEQNSQAQISFNLTSTLTYDINNIIFSLPNLICGSYQINSSNWESQPIVNVGSESEGTPVVLKLNIPLDQVICDSYNGIINITGGDYPSGKYPNLDEKTLELSVNVIESSTPEPTAEPDFCPTTSSDTGLIIKRVKIKNRGAGTDSDNNKWFPLDTIEVEVRLENNNNYDIDDIIFELGLFKKDSNINIADEMFWMSEDDEEYEAGDIEESGEDDELKHIFEFRINPEEVEDGTYYLKIKAYSDDLGETQVCIDHSSDLADSDFGSSTYYAEIKIDKENDKDKMVIIDEAAFPVPIIASCGDEVTFDVNVWNIGDKDFEDQIMVSLYNKELGIDLKEVSYRDLDAGDRAEVSFIFDVPTGIEEKQYKLYMRTYYDYDEGKGSYENDYDKVSDDIFNIDLKVEGNCAVAKAILSANLESGGKSGGELVVKATITNSGSESTIYLINVEGYDSWASLVDIKPNTLILDAGKSAEVLITFNVDRDVSGDQLFNIKVLSGGETVMTQPVSVPIEKSLLGSKDLLTALIVAISIVLILIIIVLAVKVARK